MKKLFCLLSLLTFVLNSIAQENQKPLLGISYSAEYSYREHHYYGTQAILYMKQYLDTTEIPAYGSTSGFSMLLPIKKRWFIETGLQLSQKTYRTKEFDFIYTQPDPLIPESYHFTYKYNYIDIPVKVNFMITLSKLKLFLSAGMIANNYISQRQYSVYHWQDGHETKENNTPTGGSEHKLMVSFNAGFGIQYSPDEHFVFRLQPQYTRALSPIYKEQSNYYGTDTFLYSFGLNFGVYMKLN